MRVKVHVTPDARRESVEKESETVFRIKVREPRERNLANKRVRQILAAQWGVEEKSVRQVSGQRSGVKSFEVQGVLLDKT